MKEAVIRMETAARPTTDRSASPRLLKGLLLAITLVALLATTVILCQQDIENPSYVYMILDETGMQIIDGRPDGDRTTGLLDIRADNSRRRRDGRGGHHRRDAYRLRYGRVFPDP